MKNKRDSFGMTGFENGDKIGDSDYRIGLWYTVTDKSKLPFEDHITDEERQNCTDILIRFGHFRGTFTSTESYSFVFFMNNKERGIGGTFYEKDLYGRQDEDLREAAFEEVCKETVKQLDELGLKYNISKLEEEMQKLRGELSKIGNRLKDLEVLHMKEKLNESN